MNNYLKIPFALNISGKVISADHADKDENYECISCSVKLVVKAGRSKAKHFSHPPHGGLCSKETITHKAAKKEVMRAIYENYTSLKEIVLIYPCEECLSDIEYVIPALTFENYQEEHRLSDFICDVMAFSEHDSPRLAIELVVSHKVSQHKAQNLPVYWIELDAEEAIKEPFTWRVTQSRLRKKHCQKCIDKFKLVISTCDRWSIPRHTYSPVKGSKKVYKAEVRNCFKCSEAIPFFRWKDDYFSLKAPPVPRPFTIERSYLKKYIGGYWFNTCPNCRSVQDNDYTTQPINGGASFFSNQGEYRAQAISPILTYNDIPMKDMS